MHLYFTELSSPPMRAENEDWQLWNSTISYFFLTNRCKQKLLLKLLLAKFTFWRIFVFLSVVFFSILWFLLNWFVSNRFSIPEYKIKGKKKLLDYFLTRRAKLSWFDVEFILALLRNRLCFHFGSPIIPMRCCTSPINNFYVNIWQELMHQMSCILNIFLSFV